MHVILAGIVMLISTHVTWTRGIAMAFAVVYLPVMLVFSATKPLELPLLPDLTCEFAVVYGVLLGIALRGLERLPFKWNLLDTTMVSLYLLAALAGGVNTGPELARNSLGDGFFEFLAPYFMARIVMFDAAARRAGFWACFVCAMFIAFISLIEVRLIPQWYGHLVEGGGLYTPANAMSLYRFGFSRAQSTFWQPMDQGNSGLLLMGLIAIFAATTAIRLRSWPAVTALAAAGFIAAASLSFSAYANIIMAATICVAMCTMPWLGRLTLVPVVLGIIAGVAVTDNLLKRELGERSGQFGQDLADSVYMRTNIVQKSWPIAQDAGWFGFGKNISKERLGIESVDNSYLLIIMQKGWLYFIVFMTIPFIVAIRMSSAWARAPAVSQRAPLVIAVAAIFAIMVAMYTIFFGFVYAKLWIAMLGLFASVCDIVEGRVLLQSERPIAAPPHPPAARNPRAMPAVAGRS